MAFAFMIHILLILSGLTFGYYDYKKKNDNKISIFMGANLVFVFIYGFVPIILILNDFFIGKTDFYLIKTIDLMNETYIYSVFIIIVGYTFLLIGYLIGKPYEPTKVQLNIPKKRLKFIGVSLLIVSAVSSLYIGSRLNGIFSSLSYITELRSGLIKVPSSVFLLLPLSITSFLIFFSLKYNKSKIISFNNFFLLTSLFFSVYYLLIFGGRLPVALFVLIFPMYYMEKKSKFNIKNMAIIAFFGIVLLNYLEAFFHLFSQSNYSTKSIFDNIPRLVAQFSFPYINTLKIHQFTYDKGEFRYFIDFFSWIVNYIPKSFSSKIGLDQIVPSYLVNSSNHLTTGIPTDLITFGYYQFSVPGVIIISLLFGRIMAWFDKILRSNDSDKFVQLAKIRLFQILVFYPMYADIEAFMRRRLDTVVIIIIILIYSRKSIDNKSNRLY